MNAETRIHIAVVRWWDLAASGFGVDRRCLFHAANGGRRGLIEAKILKGMAVRPGVPDLLLIAPRGGRAGLALELKSPDGRLSSEQKEMLPLFEANGWATMCAWSFDEAVGAITRYMKNGNPLKIT